MDRDKKYQYRNQYCPADRFDRVKAHRGPRRGRATVVVDFVGETEPPRPVHQAVGPVEPSVLCEQVDRQ